MKLSVCCVTYNHGGFLEEAIQSFVAQKTSFEFEIVIADDHSTDGTFDLVTRYATQYPNIKYYRHEKNIGMMANVAFIYPKCSGQYIAICDGDDYWTDPYKLQKQVDLLERCPEYSICFTGAIVKNTFNNTERKSVPQRETSIEDLLKQNDFSTSTTVFDSRYFTPAPSWLVDMPYGDFPIFMTVLYRSKKLAYCLEDITSVYRMHAGGVYQSMFSSDEKMIKTAVWAIECYQKLQQYLFNGEYDALINDCIIGKQTLINDLRDEKKNRVKVTEQIMQIIPENGSCILVDDWNLDITGAIDGRTFLPFLERDGIYWGNPADDVEAIAEIKRQKGKWVNIIVFTWAAFWWFEHYRYMHDYLEENFECVLNNEQLVVYNLQKGKTNIKTFTGIQQPAT